MFPEPTIDLILRDRALMLKKARAFFEERGVLEVDCCALGPRAAIDSNIDVIRATVSERESGCRHTSAEYAMKRLIASGSGDIYYLGHVFRKGDIAASARKQSFHGVFGRGVEKSSFPLGNGCAD